MFVHRRRVSGVALFALWSGLCIASSGCTGCGGPSSVADAAHDADARDADQLDTEVLDADATNPFDGADMLSCLQLDMAWHQAQDALLASWLTCGVDEDCVIVATSVDCKPVTGEEVEIGGCDTAVAQAFEAQWSEAVGALAAQLCSERTVACTSSSLCPAELTARCVNQRCRAQ